MTDYKPRLFTINNKQSAHIDKMVYEDKQLPEKKRQYRYGYRSEWLRKVIADEMKGGDE